MTDDDMLEHVPTLAALICAVHDRDHAECHRLLRGASTTDLHALVVMLAHLVPDDARVSALDVTGAPDLPHLPHLPRDWTTEELTDAHRRHARRERTPWVEAGEREYHRRWMERRRRLDQVNAEAVQARESA